MLRKVDELIIRTCRKLSVALERGASSTPFRSASPKLCAIMSKISMGRAFMLARRASSSYSENLAGLGVVETVGTDTFDAASGS